MSTHCRNILLRRRTFRPVPTPATPPGLVRDLAVLTPRISNSGMATISFRSPEGAIPGTLNYNVTLSGGPYVLGPIQITTV